jgi:hypothetical protein
LGDLLVRPRASFRPGLSGRYGGNLLGAVHAEIGALREPVMEFGSLGRIGHDLDPEPYFGDGQAMMQRRCCDDQIGLPVTEEIMFKSRLLVEDGLPAANRPTN